MRHVTGTLALLALLLCVLSPFLYLRQAVTLDGYKALLAGASVAWFVFATLWVSRR